MQLHDTLTTQLCSCQAAGQPGGNVMHPQKVRDNLGRSGTAVNLRGEGVGLPARTSGHNEMRKAATLESYRLGQQKCLQGSQGRAAGQGDAVIGHALHVSPADIVPWDEDKLLSKLQSHLMHRKCHPCPHQVAPAAAVHVDMATAVFTAGTSGRVQMSPFAAAALACCVLACSQLPPLHGTAAVLYRTVRWLQCYSYLLLNLPLLLCRYSAYTPRSAC